MRHLPDHPLFEQPAADELAKKIAGIKEQFRSEIRDLESQKERLRIREIEEMAKLPDPLSRA